MGKFIEIPATKKSISSRKLLFNIGVNDANYLTQTKQGKCPYYKVWHSMLNRCYSPKYQSKKPTYIGCSVCPEWFIFSNFKVWMQTQEWEGKELDKDILIRGNKSYSPDTCIFVSSYINSFLNTQIKIRGKYALGVCFSIKSNKYVAKCRVKMKLYFLGHFDSEIEAHQAYITFKKQQIILSAYEQTNLRLQQALIFIAHTEY